MRAVNRASRGVPMASDSTAESSVGYGLFGLVSVFCVVVFVSLSGVLSAFWSTVVLSRRLVLSLLPRIFSPLSSYVRSRWM